MGIEAKVIADSISPNGKRITTLQVKFHRFILPEFNTHRVFSRNFSSSRAIPTKKLLEQVATEPAMPVHWGKNEPGMQANKELDTLTMRSAKAVWIEAAKEASLRASLLAQMGAHKQIVNRLIEPYLWANGIVTSTEWDNWFELRNHPDAQPEILWLAQEMSKALDNSTPKELQAGEWHLPYVSEDEREKYSIELLQRMSAARCCRVSYLKHDGSAPNIEDDLALFDRLAGAVPLHASPLEHQATPDTLYDLVEHGHAAWNNYHLQGNFKGWVQFRKVWEQEIYAGAQPQ